MKCLTNDHWSHEVELWCQKYTKKYTENVQIIQIFLLTDHFRKSFSIRNNLSTFRAYLKSSWMRLFKMKIKSSCGIKITTLYVYKTVNCSKFVELYSFKVKLHASRTQLLYRFFLLPFCFKNKTKHNRNPHNWAAFAIQ